MPRLQPPTGFITAKEAAQMLNGSDAMLSRYVKEGRIKRYGPPERKYKFYKLTEIQAVLEARNVFETEYISGQWRENPTSKFELAQEDDLPNIAKISASIFNNDQKVPYRPTPMETRISWIRKNPETYYALRSPDGKLVGYTCILPMKRETIDRFILDEIRTNGITADDIEPFEPRRPIHLYIMAMCVDPIYPAAQKREYGMRLVIGLFTLLFNLADRGVEIETITARSHTLDGIRVLKKIGIPQLRSPIPNKNLFSVKVAESGIPLLIEYSRRLDRWKQEHENGHPQPDTRE
jgi:hypothetical protein